MMVGNKRLELLRAKAVVPKTTVYTNFTNSPINLFPKTLVNRFKNKFKESKPSLRGFE